jgi:hypothetical protein
MAKLIGNNPDQVPTNGDLGTLAFQDSDNVLVENLTSSKLVVEDNSADDALRVTQTGTGNALVVEDSTNPDSTPVVVNASGNVGIGTTSPSHELDVVGASDTSIRVRATGATSGDDAFLRMSVGNADASNLILFGDNSDSDAGYIRYQHSTDSLQIGVNASERMRIDSSGNVGIGTTSLSYQLQLSTDSAGKPSTNTWTVVSDARIKEHIEPADLDLCYNAVKNIPLKRFKWRDEVYSEEQVADRHKLGWIAQDVEAVYPKAVNIHEFRYNQVYSDVIIPAVEEELDEDGNVITEAQEEHIEKELVSEDVIEDCRNLNADQIYAAMYGSIQKLIQKVESQQSTIEILTARIEALEAA